MEEIGDQNFQCPPYNLHSQSAIDHISEKVSRRRVKALFEPFISSSVRRNEQTEQDKVIQQTEKGSPQKIDRREDNQINFKDNHTGS